MNDMADTYALSLKPYKNTVPCGGYKLTGGGQIGDSVIDVSMINEHNSIVLNSELLTKSKDNLYYDIKFSINTALDKYIFSMLGLKEALRTNNADEIEQQLFSSFSAKGRILNYKDVYNIILHLFGLECDGIIDITSDFISSVYAMTVKQLLQTINFNSLLSRVVVSLNILTDERVETIEIPNNSIVFFPNPIPDNKESDYIYFGENGNIAQCYIRQ